MQYDLNPDVAIWLDSVRGNMSRQKYITTLLRVAMIETTTTKETSETNNAYGVRTPPEPNQT